MTGHGEGEGELVDLLPERIAHLSRLRVAVDELLEVLQLLSLLLGRQRDGDRLVDQMGDFPKSFLNIILHFQCCSTCLKGKRSKKDCRRELGQNTR